MERPLARVEDILGDQGGRRRDVRYACSIPGTVTSGRGESPCRIVNLSQGGLSAHCQEKLHKGEMVEVRGLRCQVAWVTKTSGECHARLALLEPVEGTWLEQELQELSLKAKEGLQRRSSLRVGCDFPATVLFQEKSHQARVIDLGSHGARIESSQPLGSEGPLVLTLGPTSDLPTVVINAAIIAVHDENALFYGLAFAGFQQGSSADLRLYLNCALEVKRR